MGIRVRQGRRHGVVGVEAPGFLWGPHSVLEGSLNLVVILVGDLDVLESTVDDGELQGVTRLQLGDRVVRGERQSCWGRGRSGRRGRGRPTGGAAGTRASWRKLQRSLAESRHLWPEPNAGSVSTAQYLHVLCVRNESHGPFRWEDERVISYSAGPATSQTSTGPKRERSLPADQPRTVLSRGAVMASRYSCMDITV